MLVVGKEVKKETKLGLSEKKNEESFGNWYQEVMSMFFLKVSERLAWTNIFFIVDGYFSAYSKH